MNESKFKVGDRVRGVKACDHNERIIGALGTIKEVNSRYVGVEFDVNVSGHVLSGGVKRGHGWNCDFDAVELIKGKTVKPAPLKFALQFELDQDPTEYFHTLAEAKKRIKELSGRSDLKRDSIYLHTLSKTQKVELGTSISLKRA